MENQSYKVGLIFHWEFGAFNNILANFSKPLDFACAKRTQNQGV